MNSPLHIEDQETLVFDNRFVNELPGDPIKENHRRQVQGACYSRVQPATVSSPKLLAYSIQPADLKALSGIIHNSQRVILM